MRRLALDHARQYVDLTLETFLLVDHVLQWRALSFWRAGLCFLFGIESPPPAAMLWDSGEVKRTVSVSSYVVERVATGMWFVGPTCDDE